MTRSNSDWVFSRGIAVNAKRVFFTTFPNAGNDGPKEVTQVVCWSPNNVASFMLPWEAKAISFPEYPVPHGIVMGPFGQIRVSAPHGNADEIVDPTDEGPPGRGILRDLRAIGQHVYAVGMNRQCYRRHCGPDPLSDAVWRRHDTGIINSGPPDPIVGFNSIDGFSDDDIYAVGWQGEIWHHDGRSWRQTHSGTNLKLERVVCGAGGVVYAVGQTGVIIRGIHNQWDTIEQHVTSEQFWGAVWYKDRLWLATLKSVYVLDDHDSLELVNLSLPEPATCGWLMTAGDVLWSVGSHHVLSSADGYKWTQLLL